MIFARINDKDYTLEDLARLGINARTEPLVIGEGAKPLAPRRYETPITSVIVKQDLSAGLFLGISPTEKVLVYAEPGTEAPRYDPNNQVLFVTDAAALTLPPRTNYVIQSDHGSVIGQVASTGVVFTETGDINLKLHAPLEVVTATHPDRRDMRGFEAPQTLNDVSVYPSKTFAGTVYATSKKGTVAVQGYNRG